MRLRNPFRRKSKVFQGGDLVRTTTLSSGISINTTLRVIDYEDGVYCVEKLALSPYNRTPNHFHVESKFLEAI